MQFIPVIKAEFSASLLSVTLILICWFAAQETFLIIICENICAASYFIGNRDTW